MVMVFSWKSNTAPILCKVCLPIIRSYKGGFRLFALWYWCARTTQGYITWRKANVPLPPGGGGQMVQYRWQAPTCPVYKWTNGGRKLYQAEWRIFRDHPEGRATVVDKQ